VRQVKNEKPVLQSLEIIENRISEKLTVENIANSVYFSKYHYQRLFREIVGDSVMEYVTKRKLTLAGKALLETSSTILDIAMEYGYDSRDGFTRSFKAYMGVTPTEYRKYGLAAISQKTGKERLTIMYSKTTDEIIRQLNDFIAKAKEAAAIARKNEVPEYIAFWNAIADATDAFADKTKDVLEQISVIAENPDEITNRFAIIKVIEDIAFQSNLLTFNIGLTVSRGQSEHIHAQRPLCEKYLELTRSSVIKASKIAQFFNELSALIFEDMRKSAAEKIRTAIQKGNAAAGGIIGYSYIKDELEVVVGELSKIPLEDVTVSLLEDCLTKLGIISFAAAMDILRNPKDKALFDGLAEFESSLAETVIFFKTLVKPEDNPILARSNREHFMDITFQLNVLLFYTKGEVSHEKLGNLLDGGQKAAFDTICDKISTAIQFARNAAGETTYKEVAGRLYEVTSDMAYESGKLNEHGGAIKFLADEMRNLADHIMSIPV